MEFLPLGTIVEVKGAQNHQQAMITARLPLMERDEQLGYFDYAGVAYPQGQTTSTNFFFNHEDIIEVFFKGYSDEKDKDFQKMLNDALQKTEYEKFKSE